ncbi:hypothetical protein CHARACLAT_022213, partial [Characodon lateralis]|nr:hypothetical protein [Characodon lateralis]
NDVKISFAAEPVKTEDDEKSHSSLFNKVTTEDNSEPEPSTNQSDQQIKLEKDGDDCGEPEPARSPGIILHQNVNDCDSDSSETDVSDKGYWQRPSDSGSGAEDCGPIWTSVSDTGLNHDVGCDTFKTSFGCVDCGKQFRHNKSFTRHLHVHAGEKTVLCQTCGETFSQHIHLKRHSPTKKKSCFVVNIVAKHFTIAQILGNI